MDAQAGAGLGLHRACRCAPAACRGTCGASQPYDKYAEVEFQIPVGRNGDCYDRYLVRLAEMRESVKIIQQAWRRCSPGR